MLTKHGYTQVHNWEYLEQIWDIMDEKYYVQETNGHPIYHDAGRIDPQIQELNKKLSKPFYEYTAQYGSKMRYFKWLSDFAEEQKVIEEKRLAEQAQQKQLQQLVQGYEYRDTEWIRHNIGEYYKEDITNEIYWTLIGDEWFTKSNNVYITIEKAKELKKIKSTALLSVDSFLSRQFKRAGYKQRLYTGTEIIDSYGVYGIYINKELVYIGSTIRDFSIRFYEHENNIKKHSSELFLYSQIKDTDEIEFRILIDVRELPTIEALTERDIRAMELALISIYKPKYNYGGVKGNFYFKEIKTK